MDISDMKVKQVDLPGMNAISHPPERRIFAL